MTFVVKSILIQIKRSLVYNSANNKYVVKQLDLDGGNF